MTAWIFLTSTMCAEEDIGCRKWLAPDDRGEEVAPGRWVSAEREMMMVKMVV